MLAFIIRRLLQSMIVMFFVAMVAFLMFNYVGDPVHQMVGIDTTHEDREKLRVSLGLNDTVHIKIIR